MMADQDHWARCDVVKAVGAGWRHGLDALLGGGRFLTTADGAAT